MGDDLAEALAAAQALRRLDGEKSLDWRLFGVSDSDPELPSMSQPIAPWQAPMGLAFPDCVPGRKVAALAGSPFIPLREAAARLAAGMGAEGKRLAERLTADPSPIVRLAAARTLPAWADPQAWAASRPGGEKVRPRPKPAAQAPALDLKAASERLRTAREHDVIWRLTGRQVAYMGTPEAIQVLLDYHRSGAELSPMAIRPLAEACGGPEVIAALRGAVADGSFWRTQQPWALWGLSAMQDGGDLAGSLQAVWEKGYCHWPSPPEFTAARGAGPHVVGPLLAAMPKRGHWVCHALGHIGGPRAVEALIAAVASDDAGTAAAAAKALGETAALAGVPPLVRQLQHADRLRRHWAVLGLGRIGGPEAAKALIGLLEQERQRKDRLVRKAAAEMLKEIGVSDPAGSPAPLAPLAARAKELIAEFEREDAAAAPEYRPRNARFGRDFPVNAEVELRELRAATYCSIGETRVVMDWADRLMIRYGGCTPCYSNECFALDVGSGTWFPIRAADQYCHLFNEVRPNPGCSRGMVYDGVHKLTWIGAGIGGSTGPTHITHNLSNGLCAYDAALDRFYPCRNAHRMASGYSGEPAKSLAFDCDLALVIASTSGSQGIGLVDARAMTTELRKAPPDMPSMDHYPPPAFAYDPVSRAVLCSHPKIGWRLLMYDARDNAFRWSAAEPPPGADAKLCGGLVYDGLSRAVLLIGGAGQRGRMPTYLYDRDNQRWIDLQVKDIGKLHGSDGLSVFDPEHNVVLGLGGGAFRHRDVPIGAKGFYGGPIGQP